MLQLLIGRSGTGKTEQIYEQLCDCVWAGREAVLLVPEQFSFESERTLLKRLGPRMAGRVQVLSFTRLADQVFRKVGGLAGRRMDDATRALLMSRALEQVADRLTLYRRPAGDPNAVQTVLAMTAELKQCGITPLLLEQTAARMEEGTLRLKAQEMALILGAYEAMTAGATGEHASGTDAGTAYIDPMDDLTALADRLAESGIADGALVFVDSFKGFTAQEMAVLRVLLRKAERVTVALCANGIEDTQGGFGLFSPVIRTATRLRELAYQDNVAVSGIQLLTENHRAKNEALRFVEQGCFMPRPAVYGEPTQDVVIASCADRYAECDFVARSIRRGLREKGERCRDFAVVARSLDEYRGVLDAAMEKQGIPFSMDERTDVRTEPVITLVLAALDAVTGGFSTEQILRLMKTGLAGFSTHSVALVENYVLMWRIDGRRWCAEWTWNPNGLSVRADEASDRMLSYLNLLRRRLMKPLEALRAALYAPGADGQAFARAVYEYVTAIGADRLVRLRVARLDRTGESALAERMMRVWDVLMELLDKMAVVLRGAVLPPPRMTELFRLTAGLTDLGSVPQSLDAVQVGAADRIRFSAPHTVFILGANEGVFPAYPAAQGILTDNERRELIACGLPLAEASDSKAIEERFIAYAAAAAASEKLVVSSVRGNAAGESLSPSVLVESLRRILPDCTQVTDEGPEQAESERDTFECAASLWTRPTVMAATLRHVFEQRPDYAVPVAALRRASAHTPAAFENADAARRFFGGDMTLSASRVEAYHQCRFAYFCKYGLKAEPRRPADLDALTFGTLTHYVMEKLLPVYTSAGFDKVRKDRVMADAARVVQQYAIETMGGLEDKTSRFAALLARLTRVAGTLLWQVVRELRQSRFVPVDYELPVGPPQEEGGPAVPPVVLTLPDGGRVRVQGKIDRVDVYHRDDTAYVRVVDYKTGTKEFRLSDVVEGINVQMLLYIFSIWQNGGERYGRVTPAGVLYLPAKLPVIQTSRDADADSVEQEQMRALRMNGLLLDDPEIIRAMEYDAGGMFIPARLNARNELTKGASVASLEQFGLLKKRMETLLSDMAQTLHEGDIAACPTVGETEACEWCDYRAVCGHEEDDPVRFLAKRDAAQVLTELQQAAGSPE